MTVLAQKTKTKLFIMIYHLTMAVSFIAIFVLVPLIIFTHIPESAGEPFVLGLMLGVMAVTGLCATFLAIIPIKRFLTLPDVQAEADGEFLYINSTKSAKIPIMEMRGAIIEASVPHYIGREFLVHLFSEEHGHVKIKLEDGRRFKLYFVSKAVNVQVSMIEYLEGIIPE